MKTLNKLRYWCQKILPLVYDNSLSYYELLCKVVASLNDVINNMNELPDYISNVIEEELSDDRILDILRRFIRNIENAITTNNEESNTNFSKNYDQNEMIWWNDNLYILTDNVRAGYTIIEGTNVEKVEFEDLIADLDSRINSTSVSLTNEIINRTNRDWKTVFDYGYTTGSDITNAIQAFINDATASTLYIYMDGTYTINTLNLSQLSSTNHSKRFFKSANTKLNGAGSIQLAINSDNKEEIESMYTVGSNPYAKRFVRISDNATSTVGHTQNNVTFIDNVLNSNDSYFHWNVLAISNIYSNGNGENCAEYLQVNNHADNDNWALAIEVSTDETITNETHSTRGIEILLKGKGDVSSNGGKRIGIHLVSASYAGSGYNMDYGIWITSTPSNQGNGYRNGICFDNVGATIGIKFGEHCTTSFAIDMHEANIQTGAIWLGDGAGHALQFNDYAIREVNEEGVKVLKFENLTLNKTLSLTPLECDDTVVTNPTKFIRVFYNGTQYAIPLYTYVG